MARGQEAGSVRWMFVRQGGQVALIGVVVGVLGAVALTKYIQTLLFGVQRLDFAAFAGMSAVMLAVALLASYVPARRASRVDPVGGLRDDRSAKLKRTGSQARYVDPGQDESDR